MNYDEDNLVKNWPTPRTVTEILPNEPGCYLRKIFFYDHTQVDKICQNNNGIGKLPVTASPTQYTNLSEIIPTHKSKIFNDAKGYIDESKNLINDLSKTDLNFTIVIGVLVVVLLIILISLVIISIKMKRKKRMGLTNNIIVQPMTSKDDSTKNGSSHYYSDQISNKEIMKLISTNSNQEKNGTFIV